MLENVELKVNGEELKLGDLVAGNKVFESLSDVTEDPNDNYKHFLTPDENVSVVAYGNKVLAFIFAECFDEHQIVINSYGYEYEKTNLLEYLQPTGKKYVKNIKTDEMLRVEGAKYIDQEGNALTPAQEKKARLSSSYWYEINQYYSGRYVVYHSECANLNNNEFQICLKGSSGMQVLI